MAYTTIDDPSAYFQTVLWSGSGSGQAITNGGNSDLQPDFTWIKKRAGGSARSHQLYDSTRGTTELLHSDGTNAESTQGAGLTAFSSDGFTVGSDDGVDGSGGTYVAWQWKANGGTRTTNTESGNNPAGGYQANTTAGFSIVDYTGTGGAGTMAHGLGVLPQMIIVKERDNVQSWYVYHHTLGNNAELYLNTTGASASPSKWNSTTPTSTVFSLAANDGVNQDATGYIAYCFAPIQGYSKIGGYTGNGNADGTFVYTGFKPAWLLIKRTDSSGNWVLIDNKRDAFNQAGLDLNSDSNAVENSSTSYYGVDLLSNGFKLRNGNAETNGDGTTNVYMAFAEQPFVTSSGVPATAR